MRRITLLRIESDEEISLVQYEPGGAGVRLRAAARIESEDGGLSVRLPDGVEPSRHVILDLPPSWIRRRVLSMPIRDPAKVRELLPMEAEGRFQEGPDELVLDFIPLPPDESRAGDGGQRIALLAAPKKELGAILSALERTGLDPRVVSCLEIAALSPGAGGAVDALLEPPPLDEAGRLERAAEELRTSRFNLRRGELRYTAHQRETVRLLRWTVPLLIVLLLLLGANWGLRHRHLKERIEAAHRQEESVFRSVFPKDARLVNAVYQVEARTRELETRLAVLTGIDPLEAILRISSAIETAGAVELDEARMDEGAVVLKGRGDAFGTMNRFAELLKSDYASVEISDSSTDAEGGVRFTIVLKQERRNS